MTELTEAEQQKLNTGRLMRAESQVLLPLLDTKQALVTGAIIADFRAGKHDTMLAHAAELSTLAYMRQEISRKTKEAAFLEEKMLSDDKRSSR